MDGLMATEPLRGDSVIFTTKFKFLVLDLSTSESLKA